MFHHCPIYRISSPNTWNKNQAHAIPIQRFKKNYDLGLLFSALLYQSQNPEPQSPCSAVEATLRNLLTPLGPDNAQSFQYVSCTWTPIKKPDLALLSATAFALPKPHIFPGHVHKKKPPFLFFFFFSPPPPAVFLILQRAESAHHSNHPSSVTFPPRDLWFWYLLISRTQPTSSNCGSLSETRSSMLQQQYPMFDL